MTLEPFHLKLYLKQGSHDLHELNSKYLIGASFHDKTPENHTEVIAWFNNNGYHTAPVTLNLVYNVLLRNVCPNCSIQVTNKPLPYTNQSKVCWLALILAQLQVIAPFAAKRVDPRKRVRISISLQHHLCLMFHFRILFYLLPQRTCIPFKASTTLRWSERFYILDRVLLL